MTLTARNSKGEALHGAGAGDKLSGVINIWGSRKYGDPPSPNSREFGDPFVNLSVQCCCSVADHASGSQIQKVFSNGKYSH